MRTVIVAFLLAGFVWLNQGCTKNDEWPPEPAIEYISFEQPGNDTAWLTFSFRDGDGDLGVHSSDDSSIVFHYLEVVDGVATEIPLPQGFTYDMPDITPHGKNKAIEGTVKVLFTYYYYNDPSEFDAIRFRFYLKDRAGNKSNIVETPDIIVTP